MYGPANKAIGERMQARGGPPVWQDGLATAAVEDGASMISGPYDDRVTFAPAEASSAAPQVFIEDFLHRLKHGRLLETPLRDYQHMMTAFGSSLRQFLFRWSDFHTRVGILFQRLQRPKFEGSDSLPASLCLHDRSRRRGLAPLLAGRLETLSIHFTTSISITDEPQTGAEAGHDALLIEWNNPRPMSL